MTSQSRSAPSFFWFREGNRATQEVFTQTLLFMADDESYAAFLNKANNHQTGPSRAPQEESDLYLSSESDEPWLKFECKAPEVHSAGEFAALTEYSEGNARYVSLTDEQYSRAADLVAKELDLDSKKSLLAIEIEIGTRIHVYIVSYNTIEKAYQGRKSLKIET